MSKKTVDVPQGLREILQEFTVAVLRQRPPNIINFAVDYFEMKKKEQNNNENAESDEEEEIIRPPIKGKRRQGVAAESYDPEKDDDKYEKIVHEKTEEQRQRLLNATKSILLFKSLDDDQMRDVIDAMFEQKVEVGEKVITLGEDGNYFYVIESGVFDIIVKVDGVEKKVGEYNNNGSFGELALMYNTPRAATIQATTPGIVWAMTRETFRSIVLKSAFKKRQMYEELLNQVGILQNLSAYERMSIADALHTQVFEPGTKIISQGEEGNEMYFVEDGEIRITVKQTGSDEEAEVNLIKKGGFFGELALLTKHPRVASAYAVTRAKLAVLDVGSFERLLGPCLDIMQRNIDNYENQLKTVFGSLHNVPELRH